MDNKEQLGNSPAGEGTSNADAGSAASGANRPGVIASTSDVVVPPTDAEVSAAASKLAPARNFFSHRPDFSQPSAPAETGDIIIANAKPPTSSRTKLIIGAVAAVVVVVILSVVWVLLRPTSSSELIAAYSEYRDLVINGPQAPSEEGDSDAEESEDGTEGTDDTADIDDTSASDSDDAEALLEYEEDDDLGDDSETSDEIDFGASEDAVYGFDDEVDSEAEEGDEDVYTSEYDNWFIFNLESSDLDYAARTQYITTLKESYNKFLRLANRASDKVAHYEEIQTIANEYAPMLDIVTLYAMSGSISEEITARFIANADDAPKFILEAVPGEIADEDMESVRVLFAQHFQYDLDLLRKYAGRNCINEGELDTVCKLEALDEDAVSDLVTLQNENYDEIENTMEPILEEFYDETTHLTELVGVENV